MPSKDLDGNGIISNWENNMYNQYYTFDRNGNGVSDIGEADLNYADLKDIAIRINQLPPQVRTAARNMAFSGLFTSRNSHNGFQQHEVDANKEDILNAAELGYTNIAKYRWAKAANEFDPNGNGQFIPGSMGSSEARAALDMFNTGGNGGSNLDQKELERAELFFGKDIDGNGTVGTAKAGKYMTLNEAAQKLRS